MSGASPTIPDVYDRKRIHAAVAKVRSLPATLSDEDGVRRILRIRRELDRTLRDRHDSRLHAARLLRRGILASLLAAIAVVVVGGWRVVDRFSDPLGFIDEPVTFLLLFTTLFLLAWLPLIMALVRGRKLRNSGPEREKLDTSRALLLFDVAVVKGLLQEGEG